MVEGLPGLVMAIVTFFLLPDSPEKASFLNEKDKAVARARGIRQVGAAEAGLRKSVGRIVWSDIGVTLLNPKVGTLSLHFRLILKSSRIILQL